jgi:hypothetical protein
MISIDQRIANELGVRVPQVAAAVALLDEKATVPFIARYRKEATGGPSAAARLSPERTALVVIKFGDALARTDQPDLAASQYDLAATIARQTGFADVEAMARERRASVRLSR